MTRRIEERSMWDERSLEESLQVTFEKVLADKESGKLQEDERFDLIVDADGSHISLTTQSLLRFGNARAILEFYHDKLMETLAEHRIEMELDKEDGRNTKNYFIN